MKKFLSITLALFMLLALAAPAFAVKLGDKPAPVVTQNTEKDNLRGLNTTKKPAPESLNTHPHFKSDVSGTFYGYFATNDGPMGLGEYDIATGKITVYPVTAFDQIAYNGVYVGDKNGGSYYATYQSSLYGPFVLIRIDDFRIGEYTYLCDAPDQIMAMAVNNKTNVVYALGASEMIYVVDVENGGFFECAELEGMGADEMSLVMTIDNEGVMYIITSAGYMYTVDASTGKCTKVGDTGILAGYIQSLTYDYNTDTLYWFYYTQAGVGGLCSLDRKTAKVIEEYDIAENYENLGMFTLPESIPSPGESVDITGIKLNAPENFDIIAGQNFRMAGLVEPLNAYVADRSVKWTSSNDEIVKIDDTGYALALKGGEVTITGTASDGKTSAQCKVKVTDILDEFGDLSDALNKVGRDDEHYIAFCTDNTSEGYPFSVKETADHGKVGVSGNQKDVFTSSWVETAFPIHLTGGSTLSFEYKVTGEAQYDGMIFYANNEEIEVVDGTHDWTKCTFTAPRTGDYTFTWEYQQNYQSGAEFKDAKELLVNDVEYQLHDTEELKAVKLNPEKACILKNSILKLDAEYTPIWVENAELNYTSSDENVATVTPEGKVTAHNVGKTTITAVSKTNESIKSEMSLEVVDYVDVPNMKFNDAKVGETYDMTLDEFNSQYVYINNAISFAAGYKFDVQKGDGVILSTAAGENPMTDTIILVYDKDFNQVAFNDDDEDGSSYYSKLKFIPEESGTYYAVVTSSLTYKEDKGDVKLTFEDYDPVHVTAVNAPAGLSLDACKYMSYKVTLVPENNDYPRMAYVSSDESVVRVNEKGVLYGVAPGTAAVTATNVDSGISAVTTVEVQELVEPEEDGLIYANNAVEIDPNSALRDGIVKYDPDTNTMEMTEYSAPNFGAAVYCKGMIYAFVKEADMSTYSYKVRYIKIDVDDFTIQDDFYVSGNLMPFDMTYDYQTDTVYASVYNAATNAGCDYATLDLETGEFNVIGSFKGANAMFNIQVDGEGNFYGIDMDGMLYKIDKETAQCTNIANMGISTNYFSTMTYDYNRQLMYWFVMDNDYQSRIMVFDPENGEISSDDPTPGGSRQILGAFTYSRPDGESGDFTVTFLGYNKEKVAEVKVNKGEAAKAPDMTREDGLKFGFWDKDFSNVQEDLTVQGYYMGDANMDAVVDAADATLILRDAAEAQKLSGDAIKLADANENGGIDAADATMVLRYSVGNGWCVQK